MPDDLDYAALGALLVRPQVWTRADLNRVMLIRQGQVDALVVVRPMDGTRRKRTQQLLDELDRAIAMSQVRPIE